MHNMMKHIAALSLLAALAPACTEKGGETSDSSTGGTTGASEATTDATTGPTTDATDVTTTSDATTDPTTGGSDSDSTTSEPTTGEPSLCEAYAAWLVMCGMAPAESTAEIVMECDYQHAFTDAVFGPTCGQFSDAYVACLTMAACSDETACQAEFAKVEDCLPEAGAVCIKYGETIAACEGDDPAELARSCQYELNAGGFMFPACGVAAEAAFDCYGGLTCEQLGEGTGCEQEALEYDTQCGGEDGAPARPGSLEFNAHRR